MHDPIRTEDEWRREAVNALAAGDWYGAYTTAKGWISAGGGAFQLDPWLVYAASALIHGQPKSAVHSVDLALRHWIGDPREQGVLRWVRGMIIWRRMHDPKAALVDLEVAATDAPEWLDVRRDLADCIAAAATSRERTPSVKAAPAYGGPGSASETVARPHAPRPMGQKPSVWAAVLPHVSAT